MKRIVAVWIAAAFPALAVAQPTCEERLAEIDKRIASGNYPDQNVQLAKTMRDSMAQMCGMGMLDDATLAAMTDGFEDVLPVKTEEEKLAEREAKRKVAEASRASRKAAAAAREQVIPDSGLDKVDGRGRSVSTGFVDRDEDMLRLWAWDWDVHNGRARVLYETRPSRVQLGRPDWQTYVYVVETTPDGRSTQHLVTSKQAQENAALALRRGHDEVLLQRQTGPDGTPTTLERWSISQQTLLSSAPTPTADFPQGKEMTWLPFRTATSDGNVLFLNTYEPTRGQQTAVWYKATPDGAAISANSLAIQKSGLPTLDVVPTDSGGGVIPLMSVFGRETRLLTLGSDASTSSPVRGNIESLDVGGKRVTMTQPVSGGYIALTKVTADRSLNPPIHGHWLVWVGRNDIEREVYLDPLARDLNVTFMTFAVTEGGEIVLYGNSNEQNGADHVVLLDSHGNPKATAVAKQPKNGKIEGMVAEGNGVWLFGHGYPTDEFSRFRFWSERIEF